MPLAKTPRPAFPAGRFALLMLLLASAACFAVAVDPDDLIQRADQIKTASNAQFQDLLAQLNGQAGQLTALQHDWLDYLNAWQLLYRGNFKEGTNALDALLTHSRDPVLRARTHISLLSAETNAAHYEEAYANLSDLLASLPKVEDRTVRALSLDVAAQLYNQAGQYELALNFADEALASNSNAHLSCYATTLKAESLYHIRKLHADDAPIRAGIDACQKSGEILAASLIRLWMAKAQFDAGDVRSALADLEAHDALVRSTNSSSSISLYHAIMAQAYLATGDLVHATQYAHSAVDHANKQEFAPSVADAYQVLYQVAKRQGDDKAALDWYEKYAAADKGYINALSARSLAYQKVHQRVLDSERQLADANDANKLLGLRQQVASQQARVRLLYILLLVSGLVIVGGWAWRTKRSQVKFQNLARRDGLTGIANRQHFFDSAQEALRFAARNSLQACVLAMDLDHFKSVNDMHGHAAGDDALKRAVAACQVLLRSIDVFGRLGGEEFAILLPDCPTSAARQRAEQMREAIAASRREGDAAADVLVTASFGVAGTQDCGYNLTTLLAAADDAMYAAKRAGRNRVAVHRPAATQASASA